MSMDVSVLLMPPESESRVKQMKVVSTAERERSEEGWCVDVMEWGELSPDDGTIFHNNQ